HRPGRRLGRGRVAMRVLQSDHPRPLDLLAIGAGGHVAAGSAQFGLPDEVLVWDLTTGTVRRRYTSPAGGVGAHCLAVSPDGRRVAVAAHSGFDRPRQVIQIRSGSTGKVLRVVPLDPADPVQQLAFTADGTKLLARFHGRTVRVFDAQTGEPAGE